MFVLVHGTERRRLVIAWHLMPKGGHVAKVKKPPGRISESRAPQGRESVKDHQKSPGVITVFPHL